MGKPGEDVVRRLVAELSLCLVALDRDGGERTCGSQHLLLYRLRIALVGEQQRRTAEDVFSVRREDRRSPPAAQSSLTKNRVDFGTRGFALDGRDHEPAALLFRDARRSEGTFDDGAYGEAEPTAPRARA